MIVSTRSVARSRKPKRESRKTHSLDASVLARAHTAPGATAHRRHAATWKIHVVSSGCVLIGEGPNEERGKGGSCCETAPRTTTTTRFGKAEADSRDPEKSFAGVDRPPRFGRGTGREGWGDAAGWEDGLARGVRKKGACNPRL